MTHKGRLHGLDDWVRNELFDTSTYRGCIRALLVCCVITYVLWHTYDLLAWGRRILDIHYELDQGKQAWARLWAILIGGSGILASIVATIMIPINRRRAIKSAEGQWYDDAELTRDMLHAEDEVVQPESERKVRPETPEAPAQWEQESTPTHLVVRPATVGDKSSRTHLERLGGRITVVVLDPRARGRGDAKKQ